MNNKKETGGSAFPFQHEQNLAHETNTGMTLRDYFAAKAMQGILVNAERNAFTSTTQKGIEEIANRSYRIADAMIAERNK